MQDKSRADYRQPQFAKYLEEYKMIDDIWEMLSTEELLREYLPRRGTKGRLESDESYNLRLRTTSLPRAFRDGIERSAGRFGLAQLSEDTPEAIKALEKNFDGLGNDFDSVVFKVRTYLLKYGAVAGVVDFVDGQPQFMVAPVQSLRNKALDGETVKRLTVEHMDVEEDGYGFKEVYTYKEYAPGALTIHTKDSDNGDLRVTDTQLLTDSTGQPREEVYAVWFCVDPTWPLWMPAPPPFLHLAKDSIKQMHKVSELDRTETICNMQILKRYHPPGTNPQDDHADILWDPEIVQEIPDGGDLKVDEPKGTAISITHQRNNDRQAAMDRAVDAWLMEKVRTATESAIADNAEKTRLEVISKSLEVGFKRVFRYMMLLGDRRFNPQTDDPGSLILTATAYNQVTDQEIMMATTDYQVGALPAAAIQKIKIQQWKSRGYDISEEDIDGVGQPPISLSGDVLENVQ